MKKLTVFMCACIFLTFFNTSFAKEFGLDEGTVAYVPASAKNVTLLVGDWRGWKVLSYVGPGGVTSMDWSAVETGCNYKFPCHMGLVYSMDSAKMIAQFDVDLMSGIENMVKYQQELVATRRNDWWIDITDRKS